MSLNPSTMGEDYSPDETDTPGERYTTSTRSVTARSKTQTIRYLKTVSANVSRNNPPVKSAETKKTDH